MDGDATIRSRGRLPHIERDRAVYFVTFRLSGSLPASTLSRLGQEAEETKVTLRNNLTGRGGAVTWLTRERRRRIEQALDAGIDSCWLRHPEAAQVLAQALKQFAGRRYVLGPWCVMPNHVHVLVSPLQGHFLATILHSWKSFTAQRANRVLGRKGPFWQREYYDHVVRNARELERCAEYILSNPERAGLADWPWVGPGDLGGLVREG